MADTFFKHSVVAGDVAESKSGIVWFMIPSYGGAYLIQNLPPELPAYTPNNKQRDAILAITPHVEGLWADAIDISISKIVTKGYEFTGPQRQIDRMQEMFDECDGMNGFFQFMARHLRDHKTTDNGAWVEIERAGDKPGAEVISFHHLDSLRVWRTGNPKTPIYYEDIKGVYHELQWYQCFNVVDMANPRAGFFNSGYCAASRAYKHIRKLAAMDTYFDEKITGGGHTAIEFIQGVTYEQLKDAAEAAESQARDKRVLFYKGKLIIPVLSDLEIKTASIDLKGMPDGFDREKEFRIAALNYAKAVGLPPHDLDPSLTARGALGVGAATQVIEENQAGYGEGDWEKQFVKAINRLLTPDSVTFSFVVDDVRDQQARANVSSTRTGTRSAQITSGEITIQESRQIAVDANDIPRELLATQDVTTDESLSDEEKPVNETISGVVRPAQVTPVAAAQTVPEESKVNLSPSQTQALLDTVARVQSGELDYEWAINALQAIYGLTEDQVKAVLGPPKVATASAMTALTKEIHAAREDLNRVTS